MNHQEIVKTLNAWAGSLAMSGIWEKAELLSDASRAIRSLDETCRVLEEKNHSLAQQKDMYSSVINDIMARLQQADIGPSCPRKSDNSQSTTQCQSCGHVLHEDADQYDDACLGGIICRGCMQSTWDCWRDVMWAKQEG